MRRLLLTRGTMTISLTPRRCDLARFDVGLPGKVGDVTRELIVEHPHEKVVGVAQGNGQAIQQVAGISPFGGHLLFEEDLGHLAQGES